VALRGHTGAISDVSVSPDGAHAMSVGADGTVRVWALRLDDLVAIAEDGLTRTLTDAECRRYLHTDGCNRLKQRTSVAETAPPRLLPG
jgi:WD40 repeat protein